MGENDHLELILAWVQRRLLKLILDRRNPVAVALRAACLMTENFSVVNIKINSVFYTKLEDEMNMWLSQLNRNLSNCEVPRKKVFVFVLFIHQYNALCAMRG